MESADPPADATLNGPKTLGDPDSALGEFLPIERSTYEEPGHQHSNVAQGFVRFRG
ncbi:hypothetical protein FHS08_001997 [Microbacterium ulmi]|nr:hypothetical protein [Microbacterium ulmi]